MRVRLEIMGTVMLALSTLTSASANEWAVSMGGPFSESAIGIAVDGSTNCFVAGTFKGSASFGSTNLSSLGPIDSFLAKFAPDGSFVWVRQVGGLGVDQAPTAVAADAQGNSFLCGRFRGTVQIADTNLTSEGWYNLFLAKYDASGTFQWAKRIGGPGDVPLGSLAVGQSGTLFLTGSFRSNAIFGTNVLVSTASSDAFVCKLDSGGGIVWAKQAQGTGINSRSESVSIASGSDGAVFVTGFFAGETAFETNVLTSAGREDMFLARYSSVGVIDWIQQGGGPDVDTGEFVAIDSDNRCLVTGRFSGNVSLFNSNLVSGAFNDVFVAKVETNGTMLWLNHASAAQTSGLALDSAGSAYVAVRAPTQFSNRDFSAYGVCVAKYSSKGKPLWIRGLGLSCCSADSIRGVGSLGIDSYAIAATGAGDLGFTNFLASDVILARLAPPPPHLSVARTTDAVQISWPVWAEDFTLESTTGAIIDQGWTPVTNGITSSTERFYLSIQPSETQVLFRLRK